MTTAESALWRALRRRQVDGLRFRKQHALGPYILDFYCPERRLVIEVDGAVHESIEAQEKDQRRTANLRAEGLTVLRITNSDVLDHLDDILMRIRATSHSEGPAVPLAPLGAGVARSAGGGGRSGGDEQPQS